MTKPYEGLKVMLATFYRDSMEPEFTLTKGIVEFAMAGAGINFAFVAKRCGHVFYGRNEIADLFYKEGTKFDLLWMVDSDMAFRFKDFELLFNLNTPIAGAVCYKSIAPFSPCIAKLDQSKADLPDSDCYSAEITVDDFAPDKPFKVDFVGTGMVLIRRPVFKKLLAPPFLKEQGHPFNLIQRSDGIQLLDDHSFCVRARRAGFEIWAEPRCEVLHKSTFMVGRQHHLQHWEFLKKKVLESQIPSATADAPPAT